LVGVTVVVVVLVLVMGLAPAAFWEPLLPFCAVALALALTPEPVAWPPVNPVPPTVPWLETLAPFLPWAVLPVELLVFDDEFAANAL
jgi:hypothetical protein